jgi:two-component system sensor histidine kinase CpxA
MKSKKLYIKISLSFLALLFITLIVIFALFLVLPGKYFTTRLEEYTKTKVLIVKEIVEDKIRSAPNTDLSKNEQLRDFIVNFGEILEAKVWLQGANKTVVVKSFPGEIPPAVNHLTEKRGKDYGSFILYKRKHSGFYAVIPIALPEGEKGSIHIFFDIHEPPRPERGFAFGLFIVGLIIALSIIPISRFIIKPLKALNQSALQIADGDLSHRAMVNSKDEIGELCQSFNHMADKLKKMIKGGKELTANISHELRSPLARIRIAEELFRERWEQNDYEGGTRHLDAIREDIGELDRLVGKILVLSKFDIHETPLKRERFYPLDLINNLFERFKPAMSRRHLSVTKKLTFNHPFFGDRDALGTSISNILDNAVKFTPEHGEVAIKAYTEKGWLVISLTNSFETLSKSALIRIFEPFYRTEQSRAGGSGLGLAIAKKIIERHGGTISAMNSKRGLQIQICLPAAPSEEV